MTVTREEHSELKDQVSRTNDKLSRLISSIDSLVVRLGYTIEANKINTEKIDVMDNELNELNTRITKIEVRQAGIMSVIERFLPPIITAVAAAGIYTKY